MTSLQTGESPIEGEPDLSWLLRDGLTVESVLENTILEREKITELYA